MRRFGYVVVLALGACSRSGLLPGSAELAVGGASGTGGDGGASGGDSGSALGPTRRWAAVTTDDGTGAEQLFAVRFGTDRIEDVVRLDPDAAHGIDSRVWAPDAGALAFTVSTFDGSVVAYVADFRTGPPVVSRLQVSPSNVRWIGPWLDETHALLDLTRDGVEHLEVIDLDGAPRNADAEPAGARGMALWLSPDRSRLAAEFETLDGVLRVDTAPVSAGRVGTWVPLRQLPQGFVVGPEDWSADSRAFAWIDYDLTTSDALGFPDFAIDVFGLDGDVPARLPSYAVETTDHPNFLQFAPDAPRYFVHSTRIVNHRGFIAIGVEDTQTGAQGEAEPERFFGTPVGMTSGGRGIVYSGFDDEAGSHGLSFIDVTDPGAPGPTQFLQDENGKPARSGTIVDGGATLLAFTGAPAADWSLQTGPVDWVRFGLNPTLGVPVHIARLSDAATVDASALSPDESALVYRTSIATREIPDTDPLLYRRAIDELGVYWAARDGSLRRPLPTKWTAYDRILWLPDSQSVLRVAPADDPSVVSDVHDSNGQGAVLVRDGAYLLEWVQPAAQQVVALTPKFGAGRSVLPDEIALPDRWDR